MRGGEGKGRDVKGWGGEGERDNEGSRIYDEREEVKERGGKRRE